MSLQSCARSKSRAKRSSSISLRGQPKFELFADMGEDTDAQSVKRTRISEAFPAVGHKMLFLFDYGDDWRFVIEVVGIGEKQPKTRYPKVLNSVGLAPEQYGGWDEDENDDEEEDEDAEPVRPPN
jgi:hypothetical protein